MRRRLLGSIGLAIGLFAGGCRPTPEIQGAVIASPPASGPVVQSSLIPQEGELPEGTPESDNPATSPPVEATRPPAGEGMAQGSLSLESSAFAPGDPIPLRFSCDGENVSPELTWASPPDGTLSYAFIMDDPDAPGGTWVHWVMYNIPADRNGLSEAVPREAELPDGSRQGTNSGRGLGFAGPCPPGGIHRYFFRLFALDVSLDLASGATADDLASAMDGHILGQAELMGTYTRD